MKIIKYNKDNPGSESEELICENINKENGLIIVKMLNSNEQSKERKFLYRDSFLGKDIYEDRYEYSLVDYWHNLREVYL